MRKLLDQRVNFRPQRTIVQKVTTICLIACSTCLMLFLVFIASTPSCDSTATPILACEYKERRTAVIEIGFGGYLKFDIQMGHPMNRYLGLYLTRFKDMRGDTGAFHLKFNCGNMDIAQISLKPNKWIIRANFKATNYQTIRCSTEVLCDIIGNDQRNSSIATEAAKTKETNLTMAIVDNATLDTLCDVRNQTVICENDVNNSIFIDRLAIKTKRIIVTRK